MRNLSSTGLLSDEYFMRQAIAAAKTGIAGGQTPFGACIVKGNIIVSCGHNLVWASQDITAHAEITAIRQACRRLKTVDLSGCRIYSTCEPCPMCFSACHWAKINEIYFGAAIKDARKCGFSELSISNFKMKKLGKSGLKIRGKILLAENVTLLREWSSDPKKKIY